MTRFVLLAHTLVDGSLHFDWLLERVTDEERVLAFRLGRLPLELLVGERVDDAVRMADHRRQYFEFEGEVSGGRGVVRRVASGFCHVRASGNGSAATYDIEIVISDEHDRVMSFTAAPMSADTTELEQAYVITRVR